MPRRFMDDLEGEVIGEELYKCALGQDILSVFLSNTMLWWGSDFISNRTCFLLKNML